MRAIRFHLSRPRYLFSKGLGFFNRSLRLSRLGPLALDNVPEPTLPHGNWVKIRVLYGGICASDVSGIMLRHSPRSYMSSFMSFPVAMGHEIVGRVTELGREVRGLEVGDRVTVDPSLSCLTRGIDPVCPNCRRGDYSVCSNFAEGELPAGTGIGANRLTGGGWGEHVVAHAERVYRLPEGMSWEQGLFIEPLACGVHAVLKRRPVEGERVLVMGAGTLGLCTLAALRAVGFTGTIMVAARHAFQAQAARRLGADEIVPTSGPGLYESVARVTGGKLYRSYYGGNPMLMGGVDVVYDWVGSTQTLTDSMKLARGGGTLVVGGIGYPRRVDWTALWFQELTLLGSSGHSTENWEGRQVATFELALEFLSRKKSDLQPLLTHSFALEEYREALHTTMEKSRTHAIKVAFHFPE